MRLWRVVQRFSTDPSLFSFHDVVKTKAISKPELKTLYSLQSYQHCIKAFNSNKLLDCLNYALRAQKQISTQYPTEINLSAYILNVTALIYKLMEEPVQMAATLEKLFLLHSSYFGHDHPDSFKHFRNCFLAQLYGRTERAEALVKYVRGCGIEESYENRLKLLGSIVGATRNGQERKALEEIERFVPNSKEQEVMKINNKAWLEIWANPTVTKEDFAKAGDNLVEAIRLAEIEDTSNYLKQRSDTEQFMLKFFLENQEKGAKDGKGLEVLKLINKNSHLLAMNIGDMYFNAGKEEIASVWLDFASKTSVDFQEFLRVTRALVLTGRIFQQNGMPEESEALYLSILKSHSMLPPHSLQQVLTNYSFLLQQQTRFYEAEEYLSQIVSMGDPLKATRLDCLLVPQYDFSY